MDFLDFEKPIVELERRIDELKLTNTNADTAIELDDEIERLQKKSESLTRKIFGDLSEWQIAQLARHPLRPKSIQVIESISEDFQELHGDRMYADDSSIVSGLAKIESQSVMFIAQEKGNNTNEKMKRNFGMPRPEGYRKAQRMMKLAEKFSIPIITIIDTPGAFPGVGAEERGQSEAIARNLFTLASLQTPIINLVLGEGGSGGALAIGMGDKLIMLEYSIYSVISPEACSSILWRTPDETETAAEAMGISSGRLNKLGLVDEIIEEPLGGFHRNPNETYTLIKRSIIDSLQAIKSIDPETLLEKRRAKYKAIGEFNEN
ncbi:MAG: acetyl-CoA carboxylase carboxyltransferase subunit alpha [Gammaproteobacteria bacterium]|nr:acetyl-CoA carboxylase carboxyl transferase subunit alpha [Gammaproteobacteria bacterium]MBF42637.1 acetyl-CoA carboxylase carboxyl transferase subunit alpha [Gammaproteobacteria bacterium]MCH1530981.1 acetyl-CoA carboxylase carboxyltransferase subunit alpha [Gammaproteobacteria bacterium]RZO96069.1 MAG: acetyl-CoA carboxylase carboxyltransferase subunit alpha [Gammaproteobacteria bacterium]|tara:strand:- start:1224 stop:2183 length:960 start_codon:yes stop_codon:yes gene_type:complete